MTIDPRKDFRESPHGKTWNDVVDSEQFQAAAKAAFMQFCMELYNDGTTQSTDRLEGGKILLSKLMSLCEETPKPTQSTISPQLLRT